VVFLNINPNKRNIINPHRISPEYTAKNLGKVLEKCLELKPNIITTIVYIKYATLLRSKTIA
jgi:hypothetical protein